MAQADRVMDDWRGRVVYHIFLDRFADVERPEEWDTPEFIGGSLRGAIEKLPYLKELGVNALWLSPFFKGVSYHGYHITDMYSVDERFGAEEDLRELIGEAHGLGMKVICDFVPNHVSKEHPYFKEALEDSKSEYRRWFFFDKHDGYLAFLNFEELAKLNLDYAPAMEHVKGAARKWLGMGFDGMRIDHVIGLSNENVRELFGGMKEEFTDVMFVGEAGMGASHSLKEMKTLRVPHKYLFWLARKCTVRANNILMKNYVGLLDGVLDFVQMEYLENYAKVDERGKVRCRRAVEKQAEKFKDEILQFTFLDNHDKERFLYRVGGDKEKLVEAAGLQLGLKQPAIVYYGTEVGMGQEMSFVEHGEYADLLARQAMVWDEERRNEPLFNFYRDKIEARVSYKVTNVD